MQSGTQSSSKQVNNQVPMQMGGGFAGESSRRYTPSSRGILAQKSGKVYKPKVLGLYCHETWELPSGDEDYIKSSKVCNKRQAVREPQYGCGDLDKVSQDEERSLVRACCEVDEGRSIFRAIGRSSSRYGCEELAKASKIRTIPDLEEEEACFKRTQKMESIRYIQSRPGFSSTGDLDQQQSAWIPKTFQTETAMAVGDFQSWEDFISDESDEIFSDLYDSDGCTSS